MWILSLEEVRRHAPGEGAVWMGPSALVLGDSQPHDELAEDGARLRRIHLSQVVQGGTGELLSSVSEEQQEAVRTILGARGLGEAVDFGPGYVVFRPVDATPGLLAA